jgi:hypothetical protein
VKRSPYQEALTAELIRAGVTDFEFQEGSKHPRVVFQINGEKRMYVFPSSPSDSQHGMRNAIGDIRKMLGLQAPKLPRSDRPARKRVKTDDAALAFDGLTIRPDPFAKLAMWKPPKRVYPFIWIRTGARSWRVEISG